VAPIAGLSQGGNLAERSPLDTVAGPLANTQKQNLRNDGESGWGWLYWNPKSPENYPLKAQKNNLLKTKRILKPKYKPSEGRVFTLSLLGGGIRPSAHQSITALPTTQTPHIANSTLAREITIPTKPLSCIFSKETFWFGTLFWLACVESEMRTGWSALSIYAGCCSRIEHAFRCITIFPDTACAYFACSVFWKRQKSVAQDLKNNNILFCAMAFHSIFELKIAKKLFLLMNFMEIPLFQRERTYVVWTVRLSVC